MQSVSQTVAEARADLRQAIVNTTAAFGLEGLLAWNQKHKDDDAPNLYVGSLDTALDRFELAVKASMPCSNYYVHELQRDDCFGLGTYSPVDKWPPESAFAPCPSCQARQEVKDA